MTKKKKITIAVVVCLAIILAVAGYFILGRGGMGGGSEDVVYVEKVSAYTGGIVAVDRYSGVVESQKSEDFKQDGDKKILEIYVKEGDTVKVGDQLFKYDTTSIENEIASLQLELESAQARRSLYDASTREGALEINSIDLEISQKNQDISNKQQELNNAVVKSTLAGVVKTVNEEGGYDNNGNQLPIVSITQTGEFRVKGKVSEQHIGTLTKDMDVIIRSRVDESQTWKGTITLIETEPQSDNNDNYYGYGSGESASNYPFYVGLDSTDGLMLGQHVFIEPDYGQSEEREGIWLDEGFVGFDENGETYMWVSRNNKLHKQTVEIGEYDEEMFQYQILSGISEDDYIAFAWEDEAYREGMKTQSYDELMYEDN